MSHDPPSGNSASDAPELAGPLIISTIPVPGAGLMGLTNCPGRCRVDAEQRRWRRVLADDLSAIAEWGAHGIVTLNEAHEFPRLGVADLPEEIQARDLRWFHLPIPDMQPPGELFARGWRTHGGEILETLSTGNRLVIHCAAGLGRSGMLAAKILTEFAMAPGPAIALVRECRPGAIETEGQAGYVANGPPLSKAQ